jgi:GNAT superfamily N-acetyltransferase
MLVLDRALAGRVEAAETATWRAMLQALAKLPGNPWGAEWQRFGQVTALCVRNFAAQTTLGNRVMGAGPGDEAGLEEALQFLGERVSRLRVDVSPLHANRFFLDHLHALGFRMHGFQVALFREAVPLTASLPPGVTIQRVQTAEEAAAAAEIYPAGFDLPGWVDFSRDLIGAVWHRPEWRVYLARVDGTPAAMATLHMADGVGCLESACTLPAFRGRGAQSALIRQRIADAAAAGCDLIVSQTGNGTVSQNNMERCGMRIGYSKAEFFKPE